LYILAKFSINFYSIHSPLLVKQYKKGEFMAIVELINLGLQGLKILLGIIKEYGTKFYNYLKEKYNNSQNKDDYIDSVKHKEENKKEDKKDDSKEDEGLPALSKIGDNSTQMKDKPDDGVFEKTSEDGSSETSSLRGDSFGSNNSSNNPEEDSASGQEKVDMFMNSFGNKAKGLIHEFKGEYDNVSINANYHPELDKYHFSLDLSGKSDSLEAADTDIVSN
jgi:hypothetical protein